MGAWGMLSPLTEEQMNPSVEMVRDYEILRNVIENFVEKTAAHMCSDEDEEIIMRVLDDRYA